MSICLADGRNGCLFVQLCLGFQCMKFNAFSHERKFTFACAALQGIFQFTFRYHIILCFSLSLFLWKTVISHLSTYHTKAHASPGSSRVFTSATFIGNRSNPGDPCFSDTAVREFLSCCTLVRYCRKLKENTIHPAERSSQNAEKARWRVKSISSLGEKITRYFDVTAALRCSSNTEQRWKWIRLTYLTRLCNGT